MKRVILILPLMLLIPATIWLVVKIGIKSEEPSDFEPLSPLVSLVPDSQTDEEFIIPKNDNQFREIIKNATKLCVNIDRVDILKGLESIYVEVEGLKPDIEKYGLTAQVLKTDVELTLRKYGIKISQDPQVRFLYVNVHISISPNDMETVIFNVSVDFVDVVVPTRNPTVIIYFASIWSQQDLGMTDTTKLKFIRETVKDVTERFVNDYLEANPKTGQ